MAKKRRVEGDIVAIPLEGGYWGFGRVLRDPLCAFYGLRVEEIPPIEQVVEKEILFKIWVMNHVFKDQRWESIGNIPLDDSLLEEPYFAKVDRYTGETFKYHVDKEIPATKDELYGLERAAVWEPEHVEERLNDHFAGRENVWVERFKI